MRDGEEPLVPQKRKLVGPDRSSTDVLDDNFLEKVKSREFANSRAPMTFVF